MKTRKAVLAALVIGAVVVVGLLLPVRQWFMHFESYVQSLGATGPLVVVLVYILATVLLSPGSAITIGAGTMFGLKTGFPVVVLGATAIPFRRALNVDPAVSLRAE